MQKEDPLKILVVDDHEIVRRGVKQVLSERFPEAIVSEAGGGGEALRQVREQPWDAVILDITMKDQNGLDVLTKIGKIRPETPVLMLTVHPEEQFAVTAFKLGAAGYLAKESVAEELVEAVERVLSGRRYVSPFLAERLASLLDSEPKKSALDGLSKREFEVLCLLGAGRTVGQAADRLSLSVKTVSTHRVHLLKKLQLRTNAELVLYAVKNGLVR
jgi:DNA-binding NarL/FixJ family response regulator